jgi:dynein heavy chain, axonemal
MLLERQGYGLQGWNIPYKFSIDDLNISSIQVKAVLENDEANYFRILHYIIGECFYGGKVKDEQDRRYLLQALADSIRTDNSLNERLGTIAVSSNIVRGNFSLQDLNSFIDQFPETCHAEYLGLHENADMQKELRSSDRIFQKMFSTDIFWSEVKSRAESKLIESELMQDTCEMLALLPLQFDEDQVQRAFPFASNESLNIVLIREVKRFNMLTKRISSTLISLRDAVQGLKTMSADDEDALKTMKIGNIPPKWLRISYASNRRLAAYFSNLLLRIDFLKTWVKDGQPITFWMSAFFSPSAFLTAVQHNYARKWSISLCDLAFNHSVLNEEETKSCPGDGVYVDGLFCEACRWNSGQGRLDEAQRGVLSSPLPTVWFKPKAQLPQNTNWQEEEIDGDGRPVAVGIYDCPVYTTSHIQNRLLLCHVSLATSMPKSHWIRRGASLIPDMEH